MSEQNEITVKELLDKQNLLEKIEVEMLELLSIPLKEYGYDD